MKNLSSFEAFKLNKVQMNAIAGGISAEEYCKQLHDLYNNRNGNFTAGETTGFAVGWTQAGCDKMYNDVTLVSKG